MSEQDDVYESGLNIRREMFGKENTEKAISTATEFSQPLQEIVTRYCFGEVWNRSPLDRKTRSMLTLAVLTALGRSNQLKIHVKGAISNGVSKDEIREILLHVMLYAGIPAAVDGFTNAAEVLKDMDLE